MQLVVVIAVSAADSAAMTTRTMTSHTFFFSEKEPVVCKDFTPLAPWRGVRG